MTARDALSPKHRKFLDEYCRDRNGAAAVRRSGYSERRAKVTAAELLARDDIKAALADVDADNQERASVTEQQIIDELKKLGFSNMLDYIAINGEGDPAINLADLTREQAAAIQEITINTRTEHGGEDRPDAEVKSVRFKLADKRSALVDLGKHLGMFKQQVELTGPNGSSLVPAIILTGRPESTSAPQTVGGVRDKRE